MTKYDVGVVGGGLIGCATALYLRRAGARVILLERGQLNQGASGRNAGSLHFQLEHRLVQDIDADTKQLEYYVGLALLAIEHWRKIEDELGTDTQLGMHGGIMVAETDAEIELAERKQRFEKSRGLNVELLTGSEARTLAPYLSSSVRAALHCPDEGHCNPRLVTLAYAAKANAEGVQIVPCAAVSHLHADADGWVVRYHNEAGTTSESVHCGAVLNSAGVWAPRIASLIGLQLPLFPVALMMSATERTQPYVDHLVQHVGRRLSLKQNEDGNVLIGGGWTGQLRQENGARAQLMNADIRFDSLRRNLNTAIDIVPDIQRLRLLRTWTGTTANTADQLPILGEMSQAPGFYVAAGGSGFTYGPVYAKLMSELILTGKSTYPIEPFTPARFQGPSTLSA